MLLIWWRRCGFRRTSKEVRGPFLHLPSILLYKSHRSLCCAGMSVFEPRGRLSTCNSAANHPADRTRKCTPVDGGRSRGETVLTRSQSRMDLRREFFQEETNNPQGEDTTRQSIQLPDPGPAPAAGSPYTAQASLFFKPIPFSFLLKSGASASPGDRSPQPSSTNSQARQQLLPHLPSFLLVSVGGVSFLP